MKTEKTSHAKWAHELKLACTRRWKEKLVALLLAFFFWNVIRERINPPTKRQQDFLQQHGLKEQSGL
jgi:hypothetical protein